MKVGIRNKTNGRIINIYNCYGIDRNVLDDEVVGYQIHIYVSEEVGNMFEFPIDEYEIEYVDYSDYEKDYIIKNIRCFKEDKK